MKIKDKFELIEQKFKKLSDANKIRYNLGVIMFGQNRIATLVISSFLIIISYLFMLPFIIKYGIFNTIVASAGLSFFILILGFFILILGLFLRMKESKALEKFLNEKSKK